MTFTYISLIILKKIAAMFVRSDHRTILIQKKNGRHFGARSCNQATDGPGPGETAAQVSQSELRIRF